jgi:hypothetical protein
MTTTATVATHRHSVRAASATFTHECHHGFCTVCGSVWPCSRAARTTARQAPPILRRDALVY